MTKFLHFPPEVHRGGTLWVNAKHVYTITKDRLNYKGGAVLLNDGYEFFVDDNSEVTVIKSKSPTAHNMVTLHQQLHGGDNYHVG